MTENTYDFLREHIGKIVVVSGKNSIIKAKWQSKRAIYSLNKEKLSQLHQSNINLREILPHEIIIEFDSKGDHDLETIQNESNIWIDKIQDLLLSKNYSFTRTSHKGKSDHIRILIPELNSQPEQIISEYKRGFSYNLLNEISFKSNIIQIDSAFFTKSGRLLPLENKPHWKKEYNGNIEEIKFKHDGKHMPVKQDIITAIFDRVTTAQKSDNTLFSNYGKAKPNEKQLSLWLKNYFIAGKRNDCFMALSGFVARIGIPEAKFTEMFHNALAHIDAINLYAQYENRIKYAYSKPKENLAVKLHIQNMFSDDTELVSKCLSELKKAFPQNKTTAQKTIIDSDSKLKSWGYVNVSIPLLVEQITPSKFIYNYKGKIGISEIKVEGTERNQTYILEIDDIKLKTKQHPKENKYYYTPDLFKWQDYLKNKVEYTNHEILQNIKSALKTMYDFKEPKDLEKWALFILQTWATPLQDSFYFMGVDASKGHGKTTILENASLMSRHGFVAGDVSSASLPRLVEEFDLNLALDEIDQNLKNKDDEIAGILRKGQRRGNPYIRYDRHINDAKSYAIANAHSYSFRSEVEDAFLDRSLISHAGQTTDSRLSALNIHKKQILEPILTKLWFWYVSNFHTFASKKIDLKDAIGLNPDEIENYQNHRETIFNKLTDKFQKSEIEMLQSYMGRNNELAYLMLDIAHIFDLDMKDIIKHSIESKSEEDSQNTSINKDILIEILRDIYQEFKLKARDLESYDYRLADGKNKGCFFYPKNKIYERLSKRLKNNGLGSVSNKEFVSFLRDIGFIKRKNWSSQRPPNSNPTDCIIFDSDIIGAISGDDLTIKSRLNNTLANLKPQEKLSVSDLLNNFEESERDEVRKIIAYKRKYNEIYFPEPDVLAKGGI